MKRKLSKKTPEFTPPATELDLNRGIINMRGFDVDAWTTEQALLMSLKSYISLAVVGAQTAYRVHKANCRLGDYVFNEALLTMSDRADISHKWFSNYVVHDIVLYADAEPKATALPSEEAKMKTLPELVAEHFRAEQVIAAKASMYIGKTGALVITATAGTPEHPSHMRITYNNKMFAAMRFVEDDMLPVVTPKSGTILLNGALVQAKSGKDNIAQVPAPCTEFDGAHVLPEVFYFDLTSIVTITFASSKLARVNIAPEYSIDELNAWRLKNFGETYETAGGAYQYRLDTADGLTARVKFFMNRPEIVYEFEKTERT